MKIPKVLIKWFNFFLLKTKTISNEPDLDLLEAFGLRFFFMILGSQIIMFSVAWKMLPEKSGLTYS